MKITLIVNLNKSGAIECSEEIVRILTAENHQVYTVKSSHNFHNTVEVDSEDEAVKDSKIIIAVGGDGTIIKASKYITDPNQKILGVNLGKLGFMAGIEKNQIDEIPKILNGQCITEKRMMLSVKTTSNGSYSYSDKIYTALNEVVISGEPAKILDYEISLEDGATYNYRSDGVILATPTGSTAYSLSAGGPVVDPQMKCILLTPICSHSFFNRSVIYNHDTTIKVKVQPIYKGNIYLTVDGDEQEILSYGDVVEVSSAEKCINLIKLENKSFYDVVNNKLINSYNK